MAMLEAEHDMLTQDLDHDAIAAAAIQRTFG